MLRYLADENFRGAIVRGLRIRMPDVDLVRAQDVGLSNTDDREVLRRATAEDRILLTHDARTVPKYAYELLRAGRMVSGVVVAPNSMATRLAIDDLVLLAECSLEHEWNGIVLYLPL